MSYFYVILTIIFTVYGQLIIKWQTARAGSFPVTFSEKIQFLLHLVLNPWVISAFAAAFIASLTWIAAMTKLQLSTAYPFMSLSFVLVLVLSGLFFHEAITFYKILGMSLIILGIAIGVRT